LKNQKIIIGVVASILIALFIFGGNFYKSKKTEERKVVAQENSTAFEREHSPTLGPIDAKVQLVEFLDPECESCRRFHPIVKNIMKEHEGKIRLVIRYVPFHRNSRFAISVLEAARKQGKFWETLDRLFETQPEWGDHHNPRPEKIWDYLPGLGLDLEKVKNDVHDPSINNVINIDFADSKKLQVKGTPTFFINGKPLENFGEQPLRAAIKKALE